MEFRLSRKNEYGRVRKLWVQAFGEEQPWTDWYFSRHYRPEKTWVGVEKKSVQAQAHLLPHRLRLRDVCLESAYFVGVCVEKSLRGTGIGRQLLATALAELRRTGIGISILQPRWPAFYTKLGWDYCYSRQKYKNSLDTVRILLPDAPQTDWEPDSREVSLLGRLYESFVSKRHGYALRGRDDWERLLADHFGEGGRAGILYCGGSPSGYALYRIREKVLWVREMIWKESRLIDLLLRQLFVQAQKAGADSLEWDDPSGDPASRLYPSSHSEPFLMGRITDVQTVLKSLKYPADLTVQLHLRVTDSLLPWNDGWFQWIIRKGAAELNPTGPQSGLAINLGIATLSQLVFGERPARQVLSPGDGLGCLEEDLQTLERIFPACRNYISEYF